MTSGSFESSSDQYYYRKFLKAIASVKTDEELEIIGKRIDNAFETHRITFEEVENLLSKLTKRASEIKAGGRWK